MSTAQKSSKYWVPDRGFVFLSGLNLAGLHKGLKGNFYANLGSITENETLVIK